MSEKLSENNIDDIFKKGVEPLIEPSDDFWKKASDDIILRGTKAPDNKSSKRWRMIAFIFGIALLVSGYFIFKMETGLKNVERQVTELKEAKSTGEEKLNTATNNNKATANNNGPATTPSPTGEKVTINSNSSVNSNITTVAISSSKKEVSGGTISAYKSNTIVADDERKYSSASANSQSDASGTPSRETTNDVSFPTQINKSSQADRTITTDSNSIGYGAYDVATSMSTSPSNANNIGETGAPLTTDTIAANNNNMPGHQGDFNSDSALPEKNKETIEVARAARAPRFSVSVFFSPDFVTGYKFRGNDPNAAALENNIKSGEKETFAYTTGVKVNYALTPSLSFSVGMAYNSYSFSIAPRTYYAEVQKDGGVGYSIVTSSGVVNCPYYGYLRTGDSLRMNATSSRSYLSIPLQLKYIFNAANAFKIYASAGVNANIGVAQKTTMSWQDFYNETGIAVVKNATGAEEIYWGYSAALGMDYTISRHFSIYAEPGIFGAISPIDKSTPVVSYPLVTNITGGVSYHFR